MAKRVIGDGWRSWTIETEGPRLSQEEKDLLRELAKQVSEIADDPKWAEKEQLWKKLNSLQKTRPLVLCVPQGGWVEMVNPKDNVVKDEFFRWYENYFRQLIYKSKYLQDDEIISKNVYVPYMIGYTDWIENRTRPFDSDVDRAATFKPSIVETSDLKKLKHPEMWIEEDITKENFAIAHELFDGILNVVEGEPYHSCSLWGIRGWGASVIDLWIELRGMTEFLFDVYDEPEFTHDAMKFLSDGYVKMLKQAEELGIWTLNNNSVILESLTPCGSNGLACTDELPQPDYKGGKPRLKDLWGYTMAQDVTSISSDMLEEFVLPYQLPIMELFGLNSYGCCESNDTKWDAIIKTVPRLRELSVSPYSNLERALDKIGDKYVFSRKPSPGDMIAAYDPERIRKEMAHTMKLADEANAHMCLVLREIETVYHEPERITNWVNITMELAKQYE